MLLRPAKISAVISPGTLDFKVNDLQDLGPPGPAVHAGTLLTIREENRLLVFERKVLRTIYGPKIVDGVYRSKYNLERDREFNSPNVIGAVKNNRLRYGGHMIRGDEDLPQRALYRAVP
jgi:hypothetical protein